MTAKYDWSLKGSRGWPCSNALMTPNSQLFVPKVQSIALTANIPFVMVNNNNTRHLHAQILEFVGVATMDFPAFPDNSLVECEANEVKENPNSKGSRMQALDSKV
ncbi:hypothetical protein L2E82_19536 [Cichorium intybus]|uniref:Uncharacterized protein n=1 Tax=Cichorium intybus TaxID=13427 RepID=A0ACB9FCY1_CICIN|nr:hypothetical protein L2E82_19536 [Cichorium intybus]